MNLICELGKWEKLNSILNEWIQKSNPYPVILLEGEMGAGKTTFVRQYLQSLDPFVRVNSPSFNLFHEYKVNGQSYFHFDLYRIRESSELINLGFEEIWGERGIAFVEWWRIARDYFSENDILITIEIISETKRKFTLQKGFL
jgi:tRNA threonylcarbamoyladenosine biosynthesis protein TsaE